LQITVIHKSVYSVNKEARKEKPYIITQYQNRNHVGIVAILLTTQILEPIQNQINRTRLNRIG
jgi:hypothetical protein